MSSFATVWENEHRELERRAVEVVRAHELSPAHMRPGGLLVARWDVDSGAAGTALTPSSVRPLGFQYLPMPTEIGEWTTKAYPAGSATIVIKQVAQGAAWSTGTTILTIAHTGADDEDATFAPIAVPAHAHLFAFLTAVSTVELLSINLRERRL